MVGTKVSPTLRQACAVTASGLYTVGQMNIWAMSSVSMTDSDDMDILTPEQASWFASLPLLLGIPGSSLGGLLTERFGPRKFQILMTPLHIVSYASMHLASWTSVQEAGLATTIIMITRVIQSIATAVTGPVTCQYPCEMTEPRLRGLLGCLMDFWGTIGFVMCYLFGYYLHWSTLVLLLPPITFLPALALFMVSPESPIWLSRKGMEAEASEAFSCLRHTQEEVTRELNDVKGDMEDEPSLIKSIQLYKQKGNVIPQIISASMLMFKELAGNLAIMLYLVSIFKMVGVGLDPNISSVIVGSVRIVCCAAGAGILYHFPRRALLLPGITIAALANASFGIIFFMKSNGTDITPIKWLPLASLVLFVLGYATGVGTPTWLVSTEILPNSIRSLGCGINVTVYSLTAFLTSKFFSSLVSIIGLHGVFWFFSAACCGYWFLVYFFVPETRGRTLKEIEKFWG